MRTNDHRSPYCISGFLFAAVLVVLAVSMLAMPLNRAQSILTTEWNNTAHFVGDTPRHLAAQWGHRLDVYQTLVDAWGLSEAPQGEIAHKATQFLRERADVAGAISYLLALRLAVLAEIMRFFWLAGVISLLCGFCERQSKQNHYYFTSPYRMSARLWTFKLCFLGVVLAILSPVALPACVIPTLLGILTLMSGSLISGLQKEL